MSGVRVSPRRQEIVRLAGELFAEQGYATTTVRDIADRAGILSGSLYWHFAAKEDIAYELLSEFTEHLLRRYREVVAEAAHPFDALRAVLVVAVHAVGTHHAAANVLQSDKTWLYQQERFAFLPIAAEEVRQIWCALLRACVADGSVREDLDVELTFRFLRDGVWGIARWIADDRRDIDDIARTFVDHNLSGMAKDSSR